MRKLIVSILALIATFAGVSTAHAVTFDGQNFSPEYTTGITEVTFMTDQGIQATVPVWSMEACEHEDGSSQVACVWYSPSQGNGMGAVSFVKVGGDLTAQISNEAAGILLLQGTLPLVDYSTAPVLSEPVQVAPIVETAPIENEVVQDETVEIVQDEEEFFGAECDAQCEADMAEDFVTDESNDVIDETPVSGFTQSEMDAMLGIA